MNKRHPGPWTCSKVTRVETLIGNPSVTTHHWAVCDDRGELVLRYDDEGTASLVAAAPELLAACEALERVLEGFQAGARDGYTMGTISTAMDAARAAIAKAKGGAA